MDILRLIKQRAAVRKYRNKPIARKKLNKIVQAGIWGPSIHHAQPWKLLVVSNKDTIEQIRDIFAVRARKIKMPAFIACPTLLALNNPASVIFIFNTKAFTKLAEKFGEKYTKNARVAEISALAASIQNMILTAEALEIGSCWLDALLFCDEQIKELLKVDEELIAVVTLGYPFNKGKRAPRKELMETVIFI